MKVRPARLLVVFLCCAAAAAAAAQSVRSVGLPPAADTAVQTGFDPRQSVALFVGIRKFMLDTTLKEVPYAVDDAVDLAYELSIGGSMLLVAPDRVVLALSGNPEKSESQQRLKKLRQVGATIRAATKSDLLSLLEEQAGKVGEQGILIVAMATHGRTAVDGLHYLLASDSLRNHSDTALSTYKVLDMASDAPRSLIFLDTCRERVTEDRRRSADGEEHGPGAPAIEALARASGQVVFYAAAAQRYAYDDDKRRNGVFTGAVLDGLQCRAKSDDRGLITVDTLAEYVNTEVLKWVKRYRDRKATQGIQLTTDSGGKSMPLAVCGVPVKAQPASTRQEFDAIAVMYKTLMEGVVKAGETAPVIVRSAQNTVNVFNVADVRLWGSVVQGDVARAEITDLDGDGSSEVVVGLTGNGEDAGKILVFDARGELQWKADTTTTFNYNSTWSGKLVVKTFATGDLFRTNTRQIVVLSLDSQGWFPSRLCVFDRDGALLASYWHPGHMHHVVVAAATPHDEPRIIVSGLNNHLRQTLKLSGNVSTVFVLDPKAVAGEAPPHRGRSVRGTQLWYGIIRPANQTIERLEVVDFNQDGRFEISVWASSRNVFYMDFAGKVLDVAMGDEARPGSKFELIRR